tara:strand:- start:18 stop:224 length:207 start_codon:yes stop_codon:yes gene_type:complete
MPDSTKACLSFIFFGFDEIIFFRKIFFLSEKKSNDMVELKNNPTTAKIKIMRVEKNLADDFIGFSNGK